MRPYLLPILLLAGLQSLTAQRIVPLMEQPQLHDARRGTTVAARAVCGEPELEGVERIVTGEAGTIKIDLDTVGLGSDLNDYRCIGCTTTRYGTAVLRSDTILYTPNPDVQQGLDTLGLTVCSPGGVCADTVQLVILVQRPGRTIELGNRLIAPGTIDTVGIPTDELPGGAVCRTINGCDNEDYGGRSQLSYFSRAFGTANDFVYEASNFGGIDGVCVRVCNEFGLCDTYRTTFTVDRPSVELPFFDDFSYEGVRPAVALWQDEDVLVNRNYGIRPPSIGVATFDAIDYNGQPYTGGNNRIAQPRDYLTSSPVNLAGKQGTVLSFYVQPKGLGNRPELQDSFLVQFLDRSGEWNTVFAQAGRPTTESNTFVNPFTGYLVNVAADYQYDGFQFRFLNLSTEVGAVDNWHLDYVKLSNTSTSLVTQDLALTEAPFRLVAPYTSLPVRHLQAGGQALLVDSIYLKLWNHRADVTPVTASTYLVENLGDPAFRSEGGLFPSSYFGQDNGIAPRTFETRGATFDQLPTYQQIRSFLFDLDPEENYRLRTTYDLTVATEDASFAPGIGRNNRASEITVLGDYLAYDDGSAEVAIEGQSGNVIVQRYTAYVADELTGIRIRIPRTLGGTGDQNINFVVYGADAEGLPGTLLYSTEVPILYAEDYYRDSLQAFSSYELDEAVALPVGDFFVGWRQPTANRSLPVGFDRNNQPAGVQFFDAGAGWQALDGATRGAIMIRPLLSGAEVRPTSTEQIDVSTRIVDVFPNPAGQVLNIRPLEALKLKDLSYRLFTTDGRLVRDGKAATVVSLATLPAGVYVLECRIGDRVSRHKIVRR
ncbi:T9SS type A sorting domain-containing protein [Lewinella sp. JB7]|uniref:T9SS type A sorting domain-containing protein n=1 Tax=Lewinella sp. JB7 TaxID=2962887 RepID=UPI0020C9E7F9|nr:T9SS type A sorting domain-containing protein [Lewinella sp. JB7]MCP9236918.1 T9SS type A sorting domain-containing protein [Lewinella sp. JB7]